MRLQPKDIVIGVTLLLLIVFSQSIDKKEVPNPSKENETVSEQPTTQKKDAQEVTKAPSTAEIVTVHSVVDGDTVKVNYNGITETIRLLLLDAPESVHPNKPVQPFGKDASNYLKSLLKEGKSVQLEIGNPQRDKYNRLLGYIWVDGELLNEKLISYGYAMVAYIVPPNVKYLDQLLKAQEQAQLRKIGIWSIDGYVTESGYSDI
ncbi:thermonuclease family protein [Lysinibacillus sphaericus]|uniref:thermonuclease family protein n=1 Tax=Lysinibacillus sphaericus TaxID=1421 RepID=UPI0018CFD778|nr:thermonuclease family protein [Lysinibacillus sphaericus]